MIPKLKTFLAGLSVTAIIAGVVGLLFLVSFVAGQCRGNRTPKPPEIVPGQIDPGTPPPGPSSDAPTTLVNPPISKPDLTREEVLAYAKKFGLTLATKGAAPKPAPTPTSPEESTPTDALPSGDQPADANVEAFVEQFFGERRFRHTVTGVEIDVSAWQLEPEGRIEFRGAWLPWQPPTPKVEESYFGNTAKFDGFVGLGYIGQVIRYDDGSTKTFADPGLAVSLGYKSWRIKKVTIDARAIGLLTTHGGAGFGGLGLGW